MKKPYNKRIKKLKKECDTLWALAIKAKHNHKCQACRAIGEDDTGGTKDAHHIEGRGLNVRWDLENGMCLCKGHHTFGQTAAHATAHSGQVDFRKIMIQIYGTEFLKELKRRKNISRKWYLIDLEELKKYLTEELSKYEN